MTTYRDEAIVLRTHKLGEADRIITMLTRTRGKVRAVGKGVRRTKSRFGARLEPAMQVDLQAYEGRNLDTVTQAVSLATWGEKISRDYPSWTAAQAMLETADRLTEEGEAATAHYHLLAGGLGALAGRTHASGLILDSYLLRALAIGGWAPSFVDCAVCGAPGPHRAFHVPSGGVVCPSCRPPGSAAPPAATLALLAALLSGQWEIADASEEAHRNQASGLVTAYLTWHLERGVSSLRHVDRGRIDTEPEADNSPAGARSDAETPPAPANLAAEDPGVVE